MRILALIIFIFGIILANEVGEYCDDINPFNNRVDEDERIEE